MSANYAEMSRRSVLRQYEKTPAAEQRAAEERRRRAEYLKPLVRAEYLKPLVRAEYLKPLITGLVRLA